MDNLYLIFFLIALGLFLLIALYSIFKKKQRELPLHRDTSSYIDPSEVSEEYLQPSADEVETASALNSTLNAQKNSTVEQAEHSTPEAVARVEPKISNSGLCLLYTSPSPRDQRGSRMPSSA